MPADSGYGVPGTGAPKWEYYVLEGDRNSNARLSELGAAGWELVAVISLPYVGGGTYFYFKRKITA